jgi:hypothetical protein
MTDGSLGWEESLIKQGADATSSHPAPQDQVISGATYDW